MVTTITENTFNGPNQGNSNGYIPQTTIESAVMDADMNQILHDLDYHLSLLQQAFNKLDQIDLETLGELTADEIVPVINASNLKIDADNLEDTVVLLQELSDAISAHCVTTNVLNMHNETSILGTGATYSFTPTNLVTVCNNLYQELMNIRYQIHRMNGKSTWIDLPDSSISALKSAVDALTTQITNHGTSGLHVTAAQKAALDASHSPSGSNPYATLSDLSNMGAGDMLKSVYDKNNNGIVDASCALADECNPGVLKTYQNIVTKIAADIATHKNVANAHHTRYTDAEAIGAINGDTDHDSTATHRYSALIGKPPADAFLTTEVTNIRANKLANGTTPWTGYASLTNGKIVPTQLPNVITMGSSWVENVLTKAFLSCSSTGSVQSSLVGPAIIVAGNGYQTTSYSYLQISVNGGSTWVNCEVSPALLYAPDCDGDTMKVWTCPPLYVPAGKTFMIRAGCTNSNCVSKLYGGGYHLQYVTL